MAGARATIDPATFHAEWAAGAALAAAAAVRDADAVTALATRVAPDADDVPAAATGLTRREITVLRLFVAGKTNPEITAALGATPAMATADVGRLYTKLGADSRTALTAYAVKHALV